MTLRNLIKFASEFLNPDFRTKKLRGFLKIVFDDTGIAEEVIEEQSHLKSINILGSSLADKLWARNSDLDNGMSIKWVVAGLQHDTESEETYVQVVMTDTLELEPIFETFELGEFFAEFRVVEGRLEHQA